MIIAACNRCDISVCGCRTSDPGKEWYSFNDEVVTKTSEEQVLERGNVFLLFYELIEQDILGELEASEQIDMCSCPTNTNSTERQDEASTEDSK